MTENAVHVFEKSDKTRELEDEWKKRAVAHEAAGRARRDAYAAFLQSLLDDTKLEGHVVEHKYRRAFQKEPTVTRFVVRAVNSSGQLIGPMLKKDGELSRIEKTAQITRVRDLGPYKPSESEGK